MDTAVFKRISLHADAAIQTLLELAPAGLALSIITYGELYEGAYYSRNPEPALAGLPAFLEGKEILPLSQAVIERFASVRGALPR